jgi:hypothetical protein
MSGEALQRRLQPSTGPSPQNGRSRWHVPPRRCAAASTGRPGRGGRRAAGSRGCGRRQGFVVERVAARREDGIVEGDVGLPESNSTPSQSKITRWRASPVGRWVGVGRDACLAASATRRLRSSIAVRSSSAGARLEEVDRAASSVRPPGSRQKPVASLVIRRAETRGVDDPGRSMTRPVVGWPA